MADRPILFSAPMVRALLDGRKTQTRRVLNPQAHESVTHAGVYSNSVNGQTDRWSWMSGDPRDIDTWQFEGDFKTGYRPGDRLYVRESYWHYGQWEPVPDTLTKGGKQKWAFVGVAGMAQFDAPAEFLTSRSKAFPGLPRWYQRLGRFMPRKLSRLTLLVADVRVERLQDCSVEDAIAEGTSCYICDSGPVDGTSENDCGCFHSRDLAVPSYRYLWDTINGAGAWEANPWVVAVSFEVEHRNIDEAANG